MDASQYADAEEQPAKTIEGETKNGEEHNSKKKEGESRQTKDKPSRSASKKQDKQDTTASHNKPKHCKRKTPIKKVTISKTKLLN